VNHVNGDRVYVSDSLLTDPRVVDITDDLAAVAAATPPRTPDGEPAPTPQRGVVYGPQSAPEVLAPILDVPIDRFIGDEQRAPASGLWPKS
jgi:hypothetical protein